MRSTQALSNTGRILQASLDRHALRRKDLAGAAGIGYRFLWEILYGYRGLPASRVDPVAEFLGLREEEYADLLHAIHADAKLRRSGPPISPRPIPLPLRVEPV